MIAAFTEGDHADDHGDVPEHRSGVGEEEFAVAVEDTEAPGGGDEKSGTGKKDADKKNGEFAFLAVKAGSDGIDEPGSGENPKHNEDRGAESDKSRNGAGSFAGFFFVLAREKVGIDGDEGGRKDAFAEKVLQEIRDAEGGFENVGSVGVPEIVGKNTITDEPGETAE